MLGKVPIDVVDMKIDLMSLSGHKVREVVLGWTPENNLCFCVSLPSHDKFNSRTREGIVEGLNIFHRHLRRYSVVCPFSLSPLYLCLVSSTPPSPQVYGPKGVGALYVRRRPRVRLEPIFSGGGQERGLR